MPNDLMSYDVGFGRFGNVVTSFQTFDEAILQEVRICCNFYRSCCRKKIDTEEKKNRRKSGRTLKLEMVQPEL
ncbi:hypothetical protein HNY73_012037 [Argiope bruennichi]|uniref:Uncharacterized protein n=1 Tax=Argiope bruennichi TaxID=94029 RepID=A0A8T0EV87_ARGBR|nr:hypothetical protein HNY73_012037 [Argiope bruennichi]